MFLLERVSDALLRLARGELPDLLNPPAPNVSEEVARLVDATNNIIKEYANARSFLMSLSEGSLDVDPPPRNFLISPFKQLHSNLRHLTWQTQQVSKGDLSQQVDFLGDFSLAFNSMIDSLKEKRRIEEALRKSHEDLKSANTLIMESIEYASSIQKAILPSTKTFDELIKDYFIIWNPRDVIGGDLYCLDGSGDNYLLSVIDCTGHGVPGAIMTMIAASALNRATHELGYRDPAATIRRVNELVRNTLERRLEGPLYDDGLDIGTCYVNRTNREIVFAGARISLFCADDKTATEIKGDRQSVGYRSSDPGYMFTNHHVQFPTGADLYLMTDGLIEQVGGPLKLPLGKNRLIKFIVENQGRSPDEQRTLLNNLLTNYRGTEDQRDDVTVVRFRI